MAPTLPQRTLAVLRHLLNDPDAEYTASVVAWELDLSQRAVASIFALFLEKGWLMRRADAWVALTPLGRREGAEAIDPGIPLSQLDVEDPVTADKVRAMMGWAPKHTPAP